MRNRALDTLFPQASLSVAILITAYTVHQRYQPFVVPIHHHVMKKLVEAKKHDSTRRREGVSGGIAFTRSDAPSPPPLRGMPFASVCTFAWFLGCFMWIPFSIHGHPLPVRARCTVESPVPRLIPCARCQRCRNARSSYFSLSP